MQEEYMYLEWVFGTYCYDLCYDSGVPSATLSQPPATNNVVDIVRITTLQFNLLRRISLTRKH